MKRYKKIGIYAGFLSLAMGAISCSDFLNRPPKTELPNNPQFYSNEVALRGSATELLPIHFGGYESGWNRSIFGNQTIAAIWSDDICQSGVKEMTKNVPTTGGGWNFENVKKVNLLLEGIESGTLPEESKAHWKGIFLFYRALENAKLIRAFGSIPYYEEAPKYTDTELLYKPQSDRVTNMKKICADLEFAAKHVRTKDLYPKLEVNRDVVCTRAADLMLFEGSWQKYHENNQEEAKFFFQKAKAFAQMVMDTDKYRISDNYRDLFTSEELGFNPEIIMYRSYMAGKVTHSVMSFEIEQPQENAPSKSLIESFRTLNGQAWDQAGNPQNHGDVVFTDEMRDRDPRMEYCLDITKPHYNLVESKYSTSGYFNRKYIKEEYIGTAPGQSSTNTTDAPVIRYAEVLLIYAEACAELGTVGGPAMTQDDMDKSINTIRDRKDVMMPHLQISGDNVLVNGVPVMDPQRTEGVSPLIWEIRNERRIEMEHEGKRYLDLKRWKELWRADSNQNPKQNMGTWVDRAVILDYLKTEAAKKAPLKPEDLKKIEKSVKDGIHTFGDSDRGYLQGNVKNLRKVEDKHYLDPLPLDQIKLYKDHGVTLKQNPGWD